MWIIYDGCGIVCCIITYVVMFSVSGLVTKIAIWPLSQQGYLDFPRGVLVYLILLGLAGISHIRCMFTDPGSLPINTDPLASLQGIDLKNYCTKCECFRPKRAHHCKLCGRCIQRMDHHCPWVNNCVGLYTQKMFILFLFYIALACFYSFLMLVVRVNYCWYERESELCERPRKEVSKDILLGTLAGFLGVIFCLFVCIMLYDQIYCIYYNTNGIDVLKKTESEEYSVRTNFERVFGGGFGVK